MHQEPEIVSIRGYLEVRKPSLPTPCSSLDEINLLFVQVVKKWTNDDVICTSGREKLMQTKKGKWTVERKGKEEGKDAGRELSPSSSSHSSLCSSFSTEHHSVLCRHSAVGVGRAIRPAFSLTHAQSSEFLGGGRADS